MTEKATREQAVCDKCGKELPLIDHVEIYAVRCSDCVSRYGFPCAVGTVNSFADRDVTRLRKHVETVIAFCTEQAAELHGYAEFRTREKGDVYKNIAAKLQTALDEFNAFKCPECGEMLQREQARHGAKDGIARCLPCDIRKGSDDESKKGEGEGSTVQAGHSA